jgi:DDE superfamily endonuclease
MRWVTGDEVYGDAPRLRETIQAHGRFYVLAVSANTRVWTERPEVEEPAEQTGGRPRLAPRVAKGAPKARMVSEVIASLPKTAWKRLAVVEGEKGMITYETGPQHPCRRWGVQAGKRLSAKELVRERSRLPV